MLRTSVVVAAAATAVTIALGACNADIGGDTDNTGTRRLTVYAGLPVTGRLREPARAVEEGARLALRNAGDRVGRFKVRLKVLDNADPNTGEANPGQVAKNAHTAASDHSTIAYLGDLTSVATAVSLPVLNLADVLQVAPTATAVGLTSAAVGSEVGEPEKFYPADRRTFGRVVPSDAIQGPALAKVIKSEACQAVDILDDETVAGSGLARIVAAAAARDGLRVGVLDSIDPKSSDDRDEVAKLTAACFLYTGATDDHAVRIFGEVAAALPAARLFGAGALAVPAFTKAVRGGVSAAIARRITITLPTPAAAIYRAAGRGPARALVGSRGRPDPFALVGYAAMHAILDAVRRAGKDGNDRRMVVRSFFATRRHQSVLGRFSIDANGDTTLRDIGVFSVSLTGDLRYLRTVRAQPLPPLPKQR